MDDRSPIQSDEMDLLNEIAEAMTWLETAYQAETQVTAKLAELRALRSGGR